MSELALYPHIMDYFKQHTFLREDDCIYDVSQKYLNDFISKSGLSKEIDQSYSTWQIKVDLFSSKNI